MPRLFILCLLLLLPVLNAAAQTTGTQAPELVVAEAIDKFLPGFKFNKRLAVGELTDHVLLFQKGQDILIAGWTETTPGTVAIPASRTGFLIYDSAGQVFAEAQMSNDAVFLPLSRAPVFLVPNAPNSMLQVAAAASRVPSTLQVKGPAAVPLSVDFTNVLDQPILLSLENGTKMQALKPGQSYTVQQEMDMGRPSEPVAVQIGANGYNQWVTVSAMNPIGISLSPDVGGALVLSFENPSGEGFNAKAELRLITSEPINPLKFDVSMSRGQRTMDFQIPLASDEPVPYAMQVVLLDTLGEGMDARKIVLAESPITQFLSVANFNDVVGEGQLNDFQATASEGATLALSAGAPQEGLPAVRSGGMELLYQFKQAGGAVGVKPLNDAFRTIEGRPVALGMWVYGDGSGQMPFVVLMDGTGRRISFPGRPITWKGWNYVRFELDKPVSAPLLLEWLFRLENGTSPSFGRLYLNDPNWIYEVNHTAEVE
jgi:hypothetical protein